MIRPVCNKCIYLSGEQPKFRPCSKIPILHRNMLCGADEHAVHDHVTGESYHPYCEEVNRHAECLVYYPVGLKTPEILFDEENNELTIKGTNPIIVTFDDGELHPDLPEIDDFDEEEKLYISKEKILRTVTINAACVLDGVLSEPAVKLCEIPDVPEISFDKATNTVTIKSYNKVYFTTDDSEVTEESEVYEGPFVIDHNTTIKAKSFARGVLSEEVSLYCVSIEPPVINFNPETNEVELIADDTVVYSLDGSKLYDDSDVYESPIKLEHNTTVKAACLVDGVLSDEVSCECKVLNPPKINFNENTKVVSIVSENPVLFTTDGSDVKKKDQEYKEPFKITATSTIKAKSIVDGRLSEQAELVCNV